MTLRDEPMAGTGILRPEGPGGQYEMWDQCGTSHEPTCTVTAQVARRQGAPAPEHRLDLISVLRRAKAAVTREAHGRALHVDQLLLCGGARPLTPRTGLRQPPETALGAPEALRSPELVTQAPNTLSLIGYYSFFMKPSRLLPSSLGKTLGASFCNYISLVFVMAQK